MDKDEHEKDVAGKPKPIPIREAVGDSGKRPARRSGPTGTTPESQAPGLRGQRERPKGPRGKGPTRSREDGRRHGPDRKRFGSRAEQPQRTPLEPTPVGDLPHRRFEHEGSEWIVRLHGSSSTGLAMDPGAPLLHLVFYTSADPSTARGEALVPARSFEALPELQLPELLVGGSSDGPLNESGG